MDTVVVVVVATDSNAPIEVADETEGSVLETITESTVLQAAAAGLVLFVLMGTLMIRGQSRRARDQERRMMRAAELRQTRGIGDLPNREMVNHDPPNVRCEAGRCSMISVAGDGAPRRTDSSKGRGLSGRSATLRIW